MSTHAYRLLVNLEIGHGNSLVSEIHGKKAEYAKSSIRAKVEHVFGVVKKQLHFHKTRYRGLEKQRAKFNIMFAPANLILAFMQCCLNKNTLGRRHGRV